MAERAHFNIYPEYFSRVPWDHRKPSLLLTGYYRWNFVIGNDVICCSDRKFTSRNFANDDIHEFIRAIHGADCGIHPDIIDLDEAP